VAATASAPPSAHAAFGDRPLAIGDRGHDVRVLQSTLTRLGLRTSRDGHFGRRTRRNVRRYERRHDFRADGRVSRPQARGMRKRAKAVATAASAPAPLQEVDGTQAVLAADGRTALAPREAPQQVKDAIAAANRITSQPYRYGGGHGRWEDSGYDCSGAVSYALHGAGLLRRARASSGFESYGESGPGAWISVYANAGHAYVVIAGLRFDTSGRGEEGPRWRPEPRSGRGYVVRHPAGL
jgi:peptidoglycan hydrolase-like protein with peptidoglycan-binding domain